MSSIFSRGGTAGTLSQQERLDQVKNEIQQQYALANAQELTNNLNEKCYKACVPKPSEGLTTREEGCLSTCIERYLEVFNIVSRTYSTRLLKERDAAAALTGAANPSL